MSPALPSPKRAMCARCLRPEASCICGCIAPLASEVALLVLQHPMEVTNAKGSARLLHLSVAHSRLVTGETFAPDLLRDLLHAEGRTPVLLYPDLPGQQSLGIPPAPPLTPDMLQTPSRLRLVVLDGTWRKSRKMLYLNPQLQALPRLALTITPAARYRIRKAHAPDQLSTLEASCYALAQLEHDADKFAPLIAAFDRFVDACAAWREHA